MKIFLDPGHGGHDSGAVGPNKTLESHVNLAVALRLGELLKKSHQVQYSRTQDVFVDLSTRANLANRWGSDVFVSIHCNSADDETAHGTEVYYYQKGTDGEKYAQKIQKKLVQFLNLQDRGIKTANFAVLKQTKMPAILVEVAFISNRKEEALLNQDSFIENAAIGIYEGIMGDSYQREIPQTVMQLDNVWVQEIEPKAFGIYVCDCKKREAGIKNYFNLGFFTFLKEGETIPIGNLAVDGKIISQAKDNESWINVAGKELTTIYTTTSGSVHITKTRSLGDISALKDAVSGIPIIIGGKAISLEVMKQEGYFGDELYQTWHGFLGIRHGKIVYTAIHCGREAMAWNLVALGIYDAIKLDGGGSFILHNERELVGTNENRRINNVGMWG